MNLLFSKSQSLEAGSLMYISIAIKTLLDLLTFAV